jgi:hypothetical protein
MSHTFSGLMIENFVMQLSWGPPNWRFLPTASNWAPCKWLLVAGDAPMRKAC